eukprot:superscaffoldBa00002054_g13007
MVKIKEELFKILAKLKEDEFKDFKWFLEQDDILEGSKGIPVAQLERAERRDTVDLMVQNYKDPGALQVTMKVLEKINRNDLVQCLQNSCSGPKDSFICHIERHQYLTTISRLNLWAIMAKLKEELFKILAKLKEEEFKDFKWFLEQDDILDGSKGIPVGQLEKAEKTRTVDLIVQKYQDPGALHVTMRVLEKISRNDLVQCLQNSYSGLKAANFEDSDSDEDSQSEVGAEPSSPEPSESPSSYSAALGPADISQFRAEHPVQPHLKVFPKTQHGNRKRAFNDSWYKDNTWL